MILMSVSLYCPYWHASNQLRRVSNLNSPGLYICVSFHTHNRLLGVLTESRCFGHESGYKISSQSVMQVKRKCHTPENNA